MVDLRKWHKRYTTSEAAAIAMLAAANPSVKRVRINSTIPAANADWVLFVHIVPSFLLLFLFGVKCQL